MFNSLIFWFKTRILRKVVYNEKGFPCDCKGLRFKGVEPFGKDTTYYITGTWSGYTYLGNGGYTNGRSYRSDNLNPYRKWAILEHKRGVEMKQSNWMKGLLWAENYIQTNNFFENDSSGVKSLHWELYFSGEFCEQSMCDRDSFFAGARDYLEYYKGLVGSV